MAGARVHAALVPAVRLYDLCPVPDGKNETEPRPEPCLQPVRLKTINVPMKKNILVFPCGSEIGLNIHSSVRYSTHFHLIGGNSVEDHGAFVYEDYIPSIPFVNNPGFIPTLRQIIQERKIDAIYPAMDSVITALKTHEEELGCRVIASPSETTEICLSKSKTYRALDGILRIPAQYDADSPLPFPVFLKPDVGYGARNTAIVNDADTLRSILSKHEDLLILEYLPGEEYTVDCFTDRHGKLLYAAARERHRIKDGISVNTSFCRDQDEFIALADRINGRIHFRGAWFYQVKRDKDGELCLLEIASRLGGSSLLSRAVGVNLALMTLFDAFDVDVMPQVNAGYRVVLDRALENRYRCEGLNYSTVYVDYDDCLILDKKTVNTQLVSFLYQCLNGKKRLVLLTKHIGDLESELKSFRLDHLFDEIIHIPEKAEKSEYIKEINAVFIDDSFSERQKIKERIGIPVFGPEMIDALL